MKLTNKDKEFVEELRKLLEKHDLEVVLKTDGRSRMVLRGHYGDKLGDRLRLTRQGVYWRFDHIFNAVYVEAYCSIYWLESTFGTSLRQHALAIARERIALRKKALENGFQSADQLVSRRQTTHEPPATPPRQ
jgi:hypothetical protein